jgi:hypothetical protein
VIELVAKAVEALLLLGQVGGRRSYGFGLEGFMHPLVPPVLLGLARRDPLRRDAQLKGTGPERARSTEICVVGRVSGLQYPLHDHS